MAFDPTLIIFIVVALVIGLKLFSVLGTRTGHERRPEFDPAQPSPSARSEAGPHTLPGAGPAEPLQPHPSDSIPGMRAVRAADPDFHPEEFLSGAAGAYEMIIEAFASGDLKAIRPFLTNDVYAAFRQAVDAREAAGRRAELKFVGIDSAKIAGAEVEDGELRIAVEFASNQVRVTRDADGEVVEGDPNRIDLVRDRWTFVREAGNLDPNWSLAATDAASSAAL